MEDPFSQSRCRHDHHDELRVKFRGQISQKTSFVFFLWLLAEKRPNEEGEVAAVERRERSGKVQRHTGVVALHDRFHFRADEIHRIINHGRVDGGISRLVVLREPRKSLRFMHTLGQHPDFLVLLE